MAIEKAFKIKVSEFLADETTQLEDRQALVAFLDARPAYSKPTSYISDIEQRLQLLREIQQKCHNYHLDKDSTAALWSALMVVPLERLRFYRNSESGMIWGLFEAIANHIPLLLKLCMFHHQSNYTVNTNIR